MFHQLCRIMNIYRDEDSLLSRVEDYGKLLEDLIAAAAFEDIPIADLTKWACDTKETEISTLDSNLPGSVAECEDELDSHEVNRVLRCFQ